VEWGKVISSAMGDLWSIPSVGQTVVALSECIGHIQNVLLTSWECLMMVMLISTYLGFVTWRGG
jgi:hypothetical protein